MRWWWDPLSTRPIRLVLLGHVILNMSLPVFALSPYKRCMLKQRSSKYQFYSLCFNPTHDLQVSVLTITPSMQFHVKIEATCFFLYLEFYFEISGEVGKCFHPGFIKTAVLLPRRGSFWKSVFFLHQLPFLGTYRTRSYALKW